ncbi:MAG TPA: ATP-binding cassette domain-containing protein, partial [Actinomycetes bacterium]|nr:ATP-binding cassette domain-containing protein [Actinomycetes bacterium]
DGLMVSNPTSTTIELRDVTARYPGRAGDALRVTATIRSGECVVIVGPSGSGKSTLLSLLLGFLPPDSGEVLLHDELRTFPMAGVNLTQWRSCIAWVPQAPSLIAGSIADNVRLVAPHATEADVAKALRDAGADFVDDLPRGQDTQLGEGGSGVSAGQRQRLGLARAFVRDCPVVMLDEPTAGLDGPTEERVLSALRRLAVGRTLVVVAHRPTLTLLADQVISLTPADQLSATEQNAS